MMNELFVVADDENRDRTVPEMAPPAVNDWNHADIVNSPSSDSKLSDR